MTSTRLDGCKSSWTMSVLVNDGCSPSGGYGKAPGSRVPCRGSRRGARAAMDCPAPPQNVAKDIVPDTEGNVSGLRSLVGRTPSVYISGRSAIAKPCRIRRNWTGCKPRTNRSSA